MYRLIVTMTTQLLSMIEPVEVKNLHMTCTCTCMCKAQLYTCTCIYIQGLHMYIFMTCTCTYMYMCKEKSYTCIYIHDTAGPLYLCATTNEPYSNSLIVSVESKGMSNKINSILVQTKFFKCLFHGSFWSQT